MTKNLSNSQKDRWENVKGTNKKKILGWAEQKRAQGKSKHTIYGYETTLIKLARFLKKEFRYATEKDMQNFFLDKKIVKNPLSADLYSITFIQFYRWLFKLKRKERPEIMDWYTYQARTYKKTLNTKKKTLWLLERKEYEKLILSTPYTQNKALWEVFYLTGMRPIEALSMKIDSLRQLKKGYVVDVIDAKRTTKVLATREIPLKETPYNLLKWIEEHPRRNKKETNLWFSNSPQTFGRPMQRTKSIEDRFKSDLKRAKIKRHLTPKCFRKTRAYMIFKEKKLTDTDIANFFGWEVDEVPRRRRDYDLSDSEDLREKIFDKSTIPITSDKAKSEYEFKSKDLKKEINELKKVIIHMDTKYDRLLGKYGTLSHNVDELLGKKIKTKKLPKDFSLRRTSH
jgi:site-specific recombinase XerD